MVIFSNTRHVLRSLNFHHFGRSIHISNAIYAKKPSGTVRQGIKITKKKFLDLPTSRTSSDGSVVLPCKEWTGGLEEAHTGQSSQAIESLNTLPETAVEKKIPEAAQAEMKKPRKRRAKKTDLPQVAEDAASLEEVKKPRKRHVKQSKESVDTEEVTPEQQEKPKRRGRKAKITSNGNADPNSPIYNSSKPRNQLATEILENLSKFPHCILLTRVGQFYESYFDQAADVSRLLNIKLSSRVWDGHRILMCGFPIMHLDKYLKVLVQQNKRFVAMCEEFPRSPMEGKNGFERRVVRVVTPGTLIDEPFLNEYENNYLLAIGSMEEPSPVEPGLGDSNVLGLAWIDISTGEFFTKASTLRGLRDELARINPREIVLDQELKDDLSHPIHQALIEEEGLISYSSPAEPAAAIEGKVDSRADDITEILDKTSFTTSLLMSAESAAVKLLTSFLRAHLLESMPQLNNPNREAEDGRMHIDAHTIKALEIREGMREGGTTGSLLSVIKRTVTTSGTRLLARWLCAPSTSLEGINSRQSLVAFMHDRPHFRDDVLEALSEVEDITRIVQKFLLGRGSANDLLAISSTISLWSSIKKRVELERQMEQQERGLTEEDWAVLDTLMSRMGDLETLARRIRVALVKGYVTIEDLKSSVDEDIRAETDPEVEDNIELSQTAFKPEADHKWTINPEFSEHLSELHKSLKEYLARRELLERKLQQKYDAPSLTLRSNPGLGMHVHIARSKRDQAGLKTSNLFALVAESGSTSSFFYQEWTRLGNQILETTASIFSAEKEAFELLRNEVMVYSDPLRKNAKVLDELDVALAFANLATEMHFVRPTIKDDLSYDVCNGRHPTVELGLLKAGRVFTPNSVTFSPTSRLHVITGPNMAGKSTLLRQAALVAILAQTGSFVPADHAVIGIVDKVFSRVGAKDDLFRDRSTFMVEMLETAEILQRATSKSLVIMDEVGRGTTVKDGVAIAFATIHHLVTVNRCRALFATHFHELSNLLGCDEYKGHGIFKDISFFCTDVDETNDGHFTYSHRLRPGVNHNSHGLKVAQLAGMPPSAVEVAKRALSWLGDGSIDASELMVLGQSLATADIENR